MLLINPHTSFFFREEAQMVSEEGLNAYGALTWGQFFIYQGFNDKAGWMHTSSSVDNIDEYLETITKKADGSYTYRVGTEERPLVAKKIVVPYKTASGMAQNGVHHLSHASRPDRAAGTDGKWVSVRLMEEPMKALIAVVLAHQGAQPRRIQEGDGGCTPTRRTTRSMPTPTATSPTSTRTSSRKRDPKFDWTKPVDGSNPATEWNGVLSFDESPNVVNPPNGWVYNTNNYPFSAAGPQQQPEAEGLSRPTWIPAARTRAACTPSACSTARRASRSIR